MAVKRKKIARKWTLKVDRGIVVTTTKVDECYHNITRYHLSNE